MVIVNYTAIVHAVGTFGVNRVKFGNFLGRISSFVYAWGVGRVPLAARAIGPVQRE